MKKNFMKLASLLLVAVIGIGSAFAVEGSTTGGWTTGDTFENGGQTDLRVNWNVNLDRETYEVGYMSNNDPLNPTVETNLELKDKQAGDVFTGNGNVNVYWNVFSRNAFTLKLNVAEPLATLATDESKTGPNDGKINWQVKFQPKEVNAQGQVVDAGSLATLGSVSTSDYTTGYGTATPVFTQSAGINNGNKRKSAYTELTIVTQDIGDASKITGNYAGTLTLTVESV